MLDKQTIEKALKVIPYQNLYELANVSNEESNDSSKVDVTRNVKDTSNPQSTNQPELTEDERILGMHLVTSPYISYKQRGIQLKLSMRKLANAKEGLVSKEMVKEIWIGRKLFLAPTEKYYKYVNFTSPYKRCVSIDHAFSVLLAKYCFEIDVTVQKTAIEVPIGVSGQTVDGVSYLKNGSRIAWEVTLNCTNITSNAAKLKGKGFSKIIFICRDHNIKKSVTALINNAGFDPEFNSIIEVILFGDLLKKIKKEK